MTTVYAAIGNNGLEAIVYGVGETLTAQQIREIGGAS